MIMYAPLWLLASPWLQARWCAENPKATKQFHTPNGRAVSRAATVIRRARKPHACNVCGRRIEPGESYGDRRGWVETAKRYVCKTCFEGSNH
jgi:hypothetical protein